MGPARARIAFATVAGTGTIGGSPKPFAPNGPAPRNPSTDVHLDRGHFAQGRNPIIEEPVLTSSVRRTRSPPPSAPCRAPSRPLLRLGRRTCPRRVTRADVLERRVALTPRPRRAGRPRPPPRGRPREVRVGVERALHDPRTSIAPGGRMPTFGHEAALGASSPAVNNTVTGTSVRPLTTSRRRPSNSSRTGPPARARVLRAFRAASPRWPPDRLPEGRDRAAAKDPRVERGDRGRTGS